MTKEVNSRVTPALDPETYRSVEGYDDSTRGYVDDVVSLMNDAYDTLGKLHVAKDLADRNPAWTPSQRVLIVGAEAAKQKDRLARKLDRTSRDLDSRIAAVEGELLKPVQQAAAGPLAVEVRAHVKALDRKDRSTLIREALESGDEPTLQAILGAQPFLSGLTNLDREHFLRQYHSKREPHLVARLDLMKRVREVMSVSGANGPAFHLAFERVVGAKPVEVRAIEKADAAARAALKIEPSA